MSVVFRLNERPINAFFQLRAAGGGEREAGATTGHGKEPNFSEKYGTGQLATTVVAVQEVDALIHRSFTDAFVLRAAAAAGGGGGQHGADLGTFVFSKKFALAYCAYMTRQVMRDFAGRLQPLALGLSVAAAVNPLYGFTLNPTIFLR